MDPNNLTYLMEEADVAYLLNNVTELHGFADGLRATGQTLAAAMMSKVLVNIDMLMRDLKSKRFEAEKAPDPFAQLKLLHEAGYPIEIETGRCLGGGSETWHACDPQWSPQRQYRVAPYAWPVTRES